MKNPSVKKVLPYVIATISILATLTIFLPALRYNDLVFSGLDVAFGVEIVDFDIFGIGSVASARLGTNTYAIVAYFSPLIAAIITLIFKTGNVFSLAMYVLAAVLFFMLSDNIDLIVTIAGSETAESVDWQMTYGVVIAGLLSIFAALGEMLHISISEH